MTRLGAGTTISTTIELRRLNPVSAAAIAVRTVAANDGYKSTTVGEGVYQFSRVYRPRWATISGWVLTIGLLGAGYWLLLIKRTEACTMWISEDRATVRVILAGGLLPDVYEQLRSAFDEVECTPGPSSDVNESERGGFDELDDVLPSRAFRSLPTVTPGVIDLNALEREEREGLEELVLAGEDRSPALRPTTVRPTDVRPTTVRPTTVRPTTVRPTDVRPTDVRPTDVMDLPVVQFETGEQVRVMGVVFVGRDPMYTDANGRSVERFAVDDPSDTVSKTHFAMGASLTGLWVEDLFSPTGTAVGVDAHSARRIKPMERVPVAPHERIFFGERSAIVLADDDRAARNGQRHRLPLSSPSARV